MPSISPTKFSCLAWSACKSSFAGVSLTPRYYIPSYYPEMVPRAEDTVIRQVAIQFLFANFQYLSSVLIYSIGKPFRKAFWTNYPFAGSFLFLAVLSVGLVVFPPEWAMWLFDLVPLEPVMKGFICGLAIIDGLSIFVVERFLITYIAHREELLEPK